MLYDLWLTGQETTTVTLLCGFNHLLAHPEVMDKAREELLKITENRARSLSLSDRPTTPYLNAMIGEIQRHASILNVTFWKINKELTYMGGHPVDSGAVVTAQLGALHVNDTIFKNPREFDPERFIRDDTLLQKVIPFGVGKRNCLGESLARSELYLVGASFFPKIHPIFRYLEIYFSDINLSHMASYQQRRQCRTVLQRERSTWK